MTPVEWRAYANEHLTVRLLIGGTLVTAANELLQLRLGASLASKRNLAEPVMDHGVVGSSGPRD